MYSDITQMKEVARSQVPIPETFGPRHSFNRRGVYGSVYASQPFEISPVLPTSFPGNREPSSADGE
jgi:hypothetical protein